MQGVRTLPWDELRLSISTGILQTKKETLWFVGVEVVVHLLLKKFLDLPLGLLSYLDCLDKWSWYILLFREDAWTYCASRQTNEKRGNIMWLAINQGSGFYKIMICAMFVKICFSYSRRQKRVFEL